MSFETSVLSMTPITVPSLMPKGMAYLRIVPERDDRVRVERTAAGTKRLNAFWAVWLRQLILQKTDVSDGLAVELRDNDVLISAPADDDATGNTMTLQGLAMTVMHLATQVVPIPGPPMFRQWERKFEMTWWPETNRHHRRWEEFTDYEALSRVLVELQLPPHVRVESDEYSIQLYRGKRCQIKMRHLAHMVELNVALHYGLSYQSFPTPHHPRF